MLRTTSSGAISHYRSAGGNGHVESASPAVAAPAYPIAERSCWWLEHWQRVCSAPVLTFVGLRVGCPEGRGVDPIVTEAWGRWRSLARRTALRRTPRFTWW